MILLDHAASCPLRPEAARAMRPWLDGANPSSSHALGRRAREEIDRCREIVANALGVAFGEVVFTSGGTEAVQGAILGAALALSPGRIVLGAADHECALATMPLLSRLGHRPELAPVDRDGRPRVNPEGAALVAVIGLNNELGTLTDISALAESSRRAGALLMVDHVQTFGKLPLGVPDLAAVAAHKIGGPKGVGAMVVRSGAPFSPWLPGHQERERRGGTENVAAIAGFAAAIAAIRPGEGVAAGRRLREGLIALGFVPTVERPDYEGIVHVRFPGRRAETLLVALDRAGVAASAGAACASGAVEPSHVLRALGLPEEAAWEGLRFSTGWTTTEAEIDDALGRIAALVTGPKRVS